jgi:hypothetical protein
MLSETIEKKGKNPFKTNDIEMIIKENRTKWSLGVFSTYKNILKFKFGTLDFTNGNLMQGLNCVCIVKVRDVRDWFRNAKMWKLISPNIREVLVI